MSDQSSEKSHVQSRLLGGIEAGGTKYVCAVATDPTRPIREIRFSTTDPVETVAQVVDFFQKVAEKHGELAALGIGTFGPAQIHPNAVDYGCILSTPKAGWSGFPLVKELRRAFANRELSANFPIVFETDVNAAVLGEAVHGAARGLETVAYITVGTGIGAGLYHEGRLYHGRMHPEMGHIAVPDLDIEYGKATQVCSFHQSCLEGRASGTAMAARWGRPAADLPADHVAWELEARYLAHACLHITAAWSPDRILIGGGVAQHPELLERVGEELVALAGSYWDLPPMDEYLQSPEFGQSAGIVGALELAAQCVAKESGI